MRQFLFIALLFLCGVCQAGFLNDLSNAINGGGYRKHNSRSKTSYNTESKFNKYCSTDPTAYGIQIKCKTPEDVITNIKLESQNILRCKQISFGVSQSYPVAISVADYLLDNLNTCNGRIVGPNKINYLEVKQNKDTNYIQRNKTDIYYDIICPSKQYDNDLYLKLQENIRNQQNTNYTYCLNTTQPAAHNFVTMFYICMAIAFTSLLLFLYKKYKK